MLRVDKEKSLIGINSRVQSHHRRKFTCAHELGHLCLDVGLDGTANFKCEGATIESYSKGLPQIEVRANEFASELLMPKKIVQNRIVEMELGWGSIKSLSEVADVSLTAAARKFLEHTEEACALIVSKDNKISWFSPSSDFQLRINMDLRVISPDSRVGKIFKGHKPTEDFEEVSALEWVHHGLAKPSDVILECSLPMDSYGRVLTLLWDDQGIAETKMENDDLDYSEEDYDPQYGWETPTFHKSKRKG